MAGMETSCGAMRKIRLVVQYDGTDYAGFQKQPHAVTVQGELERALAKVLQADTPILAASRTDAGVHARGQVVAFETHSPIPEARLTRALNEALPPAIGILSVEAVGPQFHPRFDAVGKLYEYRIRNCPTPCPFVARYTWHVRRPLDVEAMAWGAEQLVGRHDFSAFELSGGSAATKVRCLDLLSCVRRGEEIVVSAHADGFLYMMVRAMVGTLVEVGRGRMAAESLGRILASRDRSQAGPTAPPQGLCLMRVDY